MNDEQKRSYIAGLIQEREGYIRKGQEDRIAAVDAELRRMGAIGKIPKDQAERRPATPAGAERR